MAAPKQTFHVITLPSPLHPFLMELVNRVTREGLLVPDELPYAAKLWECIKTAQAVDPGDLPPIVIDATKAMAQPQEATDGNPT